MKEEATMKALFAILIVSIGLPSLASCTYDPNSPALQAMEAPNSCGPGGTKAREQCSNSR